MTEQTTTHNQTEFNSNLATLERIDKNLRLAAQASYIRDYNAWYQFLTIIKREAIVKMKNDELNDCKNYFVKLENLIYVSKTTHAEKSKLLVELEHTLDETETFLRQIMDSRGMLLTNRDDARVALSK